MRGALPILVGIVAAMLAPLGSSGGQARVLVGGDASRALRAIDAESAALEQSGCTISFLAGGDGLETDRGEGCEDLLRSTSAFGIGISEERL